MAIPNMLCMRADRCILAQNAVTKTNIQQLPKKPNAIAATDKVEGRMAVAAVTCRSGSVMSPFANHKRGGMSLEAGGIW